MRTRNAGTPKTPTSVKKTATTRKSAAKTPTSTQTPPSTVDSTPETVTPISQPQSATPTDPNPLPPDEQAKSSSDAAATQGEAASKPTKKVTRIVKRKVMRPKTPASAKAGSAPVAEVGEAEEARDDLDPKNEDTSDGKDGDSSRFEAAKGVESEKHDDLATQKAEEPEMSPEEGKAEVDANNLSGSRAETATVMESPDIDGGANTALSEGPMEEDPEGETADAVGEQEADKITPRKVENMEEDQKQEDVDGGEKPGNLVDQIVKGEEEATQPKEDGAPVSGGIEDYGDEEGFVEPGEEDLQEDDEPDTMDEMKAFDEEHKELAVAAKERNIKKAHEIFVGGLDREVQEDDVRKAFETVGDVVEVRLLKDPTTNKNRGFAFVRFATKDQAKRALSEMKNPVICGKRCGTAPNEDNDTLFLGNICNTWTKEAIKQKLKDYNVEGVEDITLVQDPRHEGLSRGFCFIQFACHADAMFAYKRLQKPDVIFGHAERTAKVAFAEPIREPDPEVMANVKSVFVDGLPPYWDEDRVRKHFKNYGEIEHITLARNMLSAKRKDFGFVDYSTHEAAITCIEDVNSKELVDGNSKTKVRARLSNPLPKTQAVKGGMCGGFRIGRPIGRSLGRPGPPLNRPNFPFGRGSRGSFNDPAGPYGRRVPFRAGHGASGAGASGRPNFGGPRHGIVDRGAVRPVAPRREPFPIDDSGYSIPFMGRQYDDPYTYGESHGLKRPFYMTETDPAYMESSRVRPRFDYSSPSGRGANLRDAYAAGSSMYSSGYYGSDYGAPGALPRSSFNARDRSYGGGSGYGYYY